MKLACADYSFPCLTHVQALNLIASLEIDAVDIGLFAGCSHFQHKDFLSDSKGAAGKLAALLEDCGLAVADLFHQSGPNLEDLAENHPDPARRREARELFLRTLEFVAMLDASHITTLPGIHFKDEPYEDSLKRCSEELAWRAEEAGKLGITYAVEPHMWSVVSDPARTRRLLDMTPGLTLALDIAHYTAQGFADSDMEDLLPDTSHFHARCAAKDKLQTDFEKNTIDWEHVLKMMRHCRYTGYLALEYVIMDNPLIETVDNLSQTVILRDALRKSDSYF